MAERVVSFGARLTELAREDPDRHAIVFVPAEGDDVIVSRAELERESNRLARLLAAYGTDEASLVVVSLPSHPLHAKVVFAAWKLGASVLPISHRTPAPERAKLLDTAAGFRPLVSVGEWPGQPKPDVERAALETPAGRDELPLPDKVAQPPVVIGSGGTSGRPKIVTDSNPGLMLVRDGEPVIPPTVEAIGMRAGQVHLVCGPLYHTNGFHTFVLSLLLGDPVVLFERFDAVRVLGAIERYRVQQMLVVPSVLQRLAAVPDVENHDLSSLEALGYGGSHCPDWLTRRWIDLVGAERVYFGYGATEFHGKAVIRGDEWLAHPGSVGRPVASEVRILGDDGVGRPVGEVGEIYMRPAGLEGPAFRYVGAEYGGVTADGFVSVGDYGWLDGEGYLHIADRRTDMIVSGGANVYPAEVEAALSEHPEVADVAVIGLADERWGRRVHAVVEPRDPASPPDPRSLDAFCRERLVPTKCPKTYEMTEKLPRNEVGKISRRRLIDEREGGASDDIVRTREDS